MQLHELMNPDYADNPLPLYRKHVVLLREATGHQALADRSQELGIQPFNLLPGPGQIGDGYVTLRC